MGCTVSRSGIETTHAGRESSYTQLSRSFSTPIQPSRYDLARSKNSESYHRVALTSSTYGSLRLDSLPHLEEGRVSINNSNPADEMYQKFMSSHPWGEVGLTLPSKVTRKSYTEGYELLSCEDDLEEAETINMWELMEGLEEENTTPKLFGDWLSRVKPTDPAASKQPVSVTKSQSFTSTIHTIEDVDGNVRKLLPGDAIFRRGSSMDRIPHPQKFQDVVLDNERVGKSSSAMQLRRRPLVANRNQENSGMHSVVARRNVSRSQEFTRVSSSVGLSEEYPFTDAAMRALSRSQEFVRVPRSAGNHHHQQGSIAEVECVAKKSISRSQELARPPRPVQLQQGNLMMRNMSQSQELARPPLPKRRDLAASAGNESFDMSEAHKSVQRREERIFALPQPDPVLRSPMLKGLSGHERLRSSNLGQSRTPVPKPSSGVDQVKPPFISLNDAAIVSNPGALERILHPAGLISVKTAKPENKLSIRRGVDALPTQRQSLEAQTKSGGEETKRPSPRPRKDLSKVTDPSVGDSKTTSTPKSTLSELLRSDSIYIEHTKKTVVPSSSPHTKTEQLKSTDHLQETGKCFVSSKAGGEPTSIPGPKSVETHKQASRTSTAVPATVTSNYDVSTREVNKPQEVLTTVAVNKPSSAGQSKSGKRSPPVAPGIAHAIAALSKRESNKSLSLKVTSPNCDMLTSESERHPATCGPRLAMSDAVPSIPSISENQGNSSSAATSMDDKRVTSAEVHTFEFSIVHPTSEGTPKMFSSCHAQENALSKLITTTEEEQRSAIRDYCYGLLQTSSEAASRGLDTAVQGAQDTDPKDLVGSDFEHISHAEVADAATKAGTFKDTNGIAKPHLIEETIWSTGPESPPLDPELLASFEEALELFKADDWCKVRIGEDDVVVTSGSSSDVDSPSWAKETSFFDENIALSSEPTVKGHKILEDHIEQVSLQQGGTKKVVSSKVMPLEVEEQKVEVDTLGKFEKRCPPGGKDHCVLYTTSLRGIRKTFEDCSRLRMILQGLNVLVDERDIAMHAEFRQELKNLIGKPVPVPRVFIKGRYIGGAEEVSQLHEEGSLNTLLKDVPKQLSRAICGGCGGVRFVPCSKCSGSCKVINEENRYSRCTECNENGLIRCPICF